MSSTLNFSLKKSTLNAFWSKVMLLQISVGTELNSFIPSSSVAVNSFSAINDNSRLLLFLTPSGLFVSCFNGYKLRSLNEVFKTKTLLLLLTSKYF